MNFGQRVAIIRKQRGLTQGELGERIGGTSGDMVSKYERGSMTPSIDVAAKMAQALDVSLDHLVFGIVDIKNPNELEAQLQQLANLSAEDKVYVKAVIEAFVIKAKLQSIIG